MVISACTEVGRSWSPTMWGYVAIVLELIDSIPEEQCGKCAKR
jgi:hypothetical protein